MKRIALMILVVGVLTISSLDTAFVDQISITPNTNILAGRLSVSSSKLFDDCISEYATDGSPERCLIFGKDDIAQRLSVSGFNSNIKEICIWTAESDTGRVPAIVTLRSSKKDTQSLAPADYETNLGVFYLTPHAFNQIQVDPKWLSKGLKAACLAVNVPAGSRSLLADFGPTSSFNGMSARVSEIQAFATTYNSTTPIQPLKVLNCKTNKKDRPIVQISGLDWSSKCAQQLCGEFPDLEFAGGYGYDQTKYNDPSHTNTDLYYCSGHPFFFHPELLKSGERPYVTGYDGQSINDNPGKYDAYTLTHEAAFQHPALLRVWRELMPLIEANHHKAVIISDHHYPFGVTGYQPSGYSQLEQDSFRSDLAGLDSGLSVYDASGKIIKWTFWDYFRFYNGFKWSAADAGLNRWTDFSSNTGDWSGTSTAKNRQIYLFYALLRYETLKFDSALGQECKKFGTQLFPLYVGETPWHGVDRLVALRTVGINIWGHEQFSQPINTYEDFQDHTSEIPYSYWGNLSTSNRTSRNKLGLVLELCHFAQQGGIPYWSSTYTFANALDLFLSGKIRNVDIDFFPTSDPKSTEYILKIAGLQAMLHAESFSARNNNIQHLQRRILVIGQRGIDRKDYPFTPDGMVGTGAGVVFRKTGTEIGSVPWLLNRLGYEFDFCDITLSGVNLNHYSVIFYDSRDLPDGLFAKLHVWLDGKGISKKRLITYGALPTRRINDPGWDAGDPTGIRSGGMKIVDPTSGALIGLKHIEPGTPILTTVKTVGSQNEYDFKSINRSTSKTGQISATPTYISKGLNAILNSGNQPVLSICKMGSSNELLYFNYDFGCTGNYDFDAPLMKCILNACKIKSVFSETPAENTSVHSYQMMGAPGTRLIIVKDRSAIEKEIINNTINGDMKFVIGPITGRTLNVRLKRWLPGDYKVYSFNRDQIIDLSANKKYIELSLTDQMSDVFMIVPKNTDIKWLTMLKSTRQQMKYYMGPTIDNLLMKAWGRFSD